jgi:Domain of unknown function (DUF4386)
MTLTEIGQSQHRAARIAGFAGLVPLPFVIYANFAVHERLIVAGDVGQTASNILAHETLFRFSMICDLVYTGGAMLFLAALYVVLRPVNRTLAFVAALWRLVFAVLWLQATMNLYDGLRLVKGGEYLQVFDPPRLHALANLLFDARSDQYYVGLVFWAVAATLCAWLLLEARYIPRWLAGFGVIASAWCAAITLVYLIWPTTRDVVNLWWFDTPMTLFEIVTSFWLLFKGLPKAAPADLRPRAV